MTPLRAYIQLRERLVRLSRPEYLDPDTRAEMEAIDDAQELLWSQMTESERAELQRYVQWLNDCELNPPKWTRLDVALARWWADQYAYMLKDSAVLCEPAAEVTL